MAGVHDRQELRRALGTAGIDVGLRTITTDLAAIQNAWREQAATSIANEKALDLARIERAIQALWTAVVEGKWPALDRLLRLLERKSRILGYDAPPLIDISQQLREEAVKCGLDPDQVVRVGQEYAGRMRRN